MTGVAMTLEAAALLAFILAIVGVGVGAGVYRALVELRRVPPGAYAEMENTLADMTRQMSELRAQQAADHLAMRQMAMQITRLEIGVIRLTEQVMQLGGVPVYTHEPSPAPPPVTDDRVLSAALATLFNGDELTALADELRVPDGTLAGETNTRRARELVEYMRRRNRLGELVTAAREARPDGGF